MEQVLTAVEGPQMNARFHIVYYLKKDIQPVLTGVNIEAKNMLDAIIIFLNEHPERVDDILYIIKIETR